MKKLATALFATALLTACGAGNKDNDSVQSVSSAWTVEVYAMMDEDRQLLGGLDLDDGDCLREALVRTRKSSVADTSRINMALEANRDVLDSLGLKTAWIAYEDTTNLDLVLYRSEPLLSDTISDVDVSEYSGYAENVLLAFEFSRPHEWEIITRDMTGRRMALAVNGEVVNTPLVNAAVTGGGCTIVLPLSRVHKHFPGVDLCMRRNDD